MKFSGWIRIVGYGLVLGGLLVVWVRRPNVGVIPVAVHQGDDDYHWGEGPPRNPVVTAKARTIKAITVSTRSTDFAPTVIRLSSDGRLRREVTYFDPDDLRPRPAKPRRVETSEGANSGFMFEDLAYLVAGLDFRPLGEPGWWGRELLVEFEDGRTQNNAFKNEPPELWAIFEAVMRINDKTKWTVTSVREYPVN